MNDGLSNLTRQTASTFGLPNGFFIVGDNAYTCTDSLIVPYPGHGLPVELDAYNFYQVFTDDRIYSLSHVVTRVKFASTSNVHLECSSIAGVFFGNLSELISEGFPPLFLFV